MSIVDAKSIVGVFAISQGKIIEVEINTCDENEKNNFLNDIRKFEVE